MAAALGACSGGESGLVLGRPEPQVQAGASTGGVLGAVGGTGMKTGGEPGSPNVSGGASDASAGAGGAGAEPSNPPWVDEKCSPNISFENRDQTSQGQLFTDAVPDPSAVVWEAAHDACRLLYHEATEVRAVSEISLVVEDYAGIASASGNMLHLSTRYLKSQADRGVDLRQEIAGILHFSTALVFENPGADMDPMTPGWLHVGIADYVRLESGYIDRADRAKGGNYDSGSKTTAFFLDYLSTKNPNLVYSLNQRLAPAAPVWNDDVFVSLMGSDLSTLWAEYQATL